MEECRHFLDCIQRRVSPRTDGLNGVRVLKILKGCQDSLEREGKVISLSCSAPVAQDFYHHPTATIDSPSCIGEGTHIWHYSHVMKDAKIGMRCRIGQNVFVGPGVRIGDNVKVQNNVSIYEWV